MVKKEVRAISYKGEILCDCSKLEAHLIFLIGVHLFSISLLRNQNSERNKSSKK